MKNLALLAAALLAACGTHPVDRSGVQNFGAAVEMMQHHQADRAPVSHAPPESNGAAGALSQLRFETGHSPELLPSSSSTANPSTAAH